MKPSTGGRSSPPTYSIDSSPPIECPVRSTRPRSAARRTASSIVANAPSRVKVSAMRVPWPGRSTAMDGTSRAARCSRCARHMVADVRMPCTITTVVVIASAYADADP